MGGKSGGDDIETYEQAKTPARNTMSASAASARAQMLRRGISSTFSRRSYGSGGGGSMMQPYSSSNGAKLG